MITITGASGSGKSTLLRALARLGPISAGSLTLKGKPSDHIRPTQWRRSIILSPQKPVATPGTVKDNLLSGFCLGISKKLGQLPPDNNTLFIEMQSLGLDHIDLLRSAADISGGELARVCVLRSLLAAPDILLCDEPTSSLDPENEHLLLERLRQFARNGGSVVVVRHCAETPLGFIQYHLNDRRLQVVI